MESDVRTMTSRYDYVLKYDPDIAKRKEWENRSPETISRLS